MGKIIDLTGKRFGHLTVIRRVEDSVMPSGRCEPMWLCQCDCGNQTSVRGVFLRSGHTKSCGCKKTGHNFVDLTGKRFGHILVLSRFSNECPPKWKCLCGCGNEFVTRGSFLVNGHTKSCGCRKKQLRIKDMVGKRFGHLVVLKQGADEVTKNGLRHIRWVCKCDCGRISLIRGTSLRNGHTLSCGCLRVEALQDSPTSYGELWISEYLAEKGYTYVSQKSYPSLVSASNSLLYFDFAVECSNGYTILVECQGRQHYEAVDYFGGQIGFQKQLDNDMRKRLYVDKHKKLFLLEIDYSQRQNKDMFLEIFENKLEFYLRKCNEDI